MREPEIFSLENASAMVALAASEANVQRWKEQAECSVVYGPKTMP
jgi:hypothetical protein